MPKRKSHEDRASLRASQREGVVLDCSAHAFRDLMTEQSKGADRKWATFYLAARSDFVAAGLPEEVFPIGESPADFRINGQPARIARRGVLFELELHWPDDSPWYHSAGHPAIAETERMVRCELSYWLGDSVDDELPVKHLAESPLAADYHLPASKRFKLARGQKMAIYRMAEYLYGIIHDSELMPVVEAPATKSKPPSRGKVVDISASRRASSQSKAP